MSDPSAADENLTHAPESKGPAPAVDQTCLHSDVGQSVLHARDEKLADVPRVVLRDEAAGDADPVVQSQSQEMPAGKGGSRYQVHGEIARGGMGAILKGRDTDLGRDLAIKVLLDAHKGKPDVVRRFIEEAQIGGQLQHPGIVPVYELGRFPDERPFFSMKLVKGQTLSSLLAERTDLAEDRPRFLGIFQQICQTLAYAHSKGVIHRDLKPANIMVGAFGEVQVMDWGLAKVLAAGGVADERKALLSHQDVSVIHTVREDSADGTPVVGSHTLAGSVMGTPAYMAPEQALGEVDRQDERADVFGLGAILCEILTGTPPYTGKDGKAVYHLATRGKLDDCHARLQACGAEPDLVELAKQCLAAEPEQRLRNAGVVAERVSVYLASVESRLRAAEIERAAEAARAEEALHTAAEHEAAARAERRARRWQVGMAVVVLALTTLAGIAAAWAARYQSRLKEDARMAERQAVQAREAESEQRQRAEVEKKRADVTLADMQTARGLLAGERDAPAEAVLWFAAAAEQAATAEDSRRQEQNRLRARNWMRQATMPIAVLSVEAYPVQMDFQPGGELLLVRTERQLFLWSWREGKLLPWAEELANVSASCISPDGAAAAVGFASGAVQIRSLPDGRPIANFKHDGRIQALAFSADGKWLAVGATSARVWDTERKTFLDPVWQHPKEVRAVAFDRRAEHLITACYDQLARVFAVAGQPDRPQPLYEPLIHAPEMPSPPALVDDDRTLVTVSGNKELTRWDLATGKPLADPISSQAWALQSVVASPDGNWFVTGGYYGPEVYAAGAAQPPLHLGHTNLVRSYSFSRDGMLLVSSGWDGTARLWSLPSGRPVGPPLAHMGKVDRCALSGDARFVATAQADGLIRLWERPGNELVKGHTGGWGERPRLSFDGQLIAPGIWHEAPFGYRHQGKDRLRVLKTLDGQPAGPEIVLPGQLVDSCVCGDNHSVAAICTRGDMGLLGAWDVATARPLTEPVELPALAMSVAARPGGSQVAVLCITGEMLVIDVRTGQAVLRKRHDGWTWDNERRCQVQYTPDGKTLVALSSGRDGSLHVWDADSGELRFAPLSPTLRNGDFCRSFALSADGRMLASMVNGKNAAQVWDLTTGRALSQPLLHPGDFYGLFSVRFSPDGQHLLTGCKDGQVRYWDWRAGTLACPPLPHGDEVYDVAFTQDGRHALTTVRNAPQLHLWELTTGRRMAPPIQLDGAPDASTHTLVVTPDGRQALVCFKPADLAVIDLEALLSPSAMPAADLERMAELATAQRIEIGDLSGLTSEQWLQRWAELRERNPQLARSAVTEPDEARVQAGYAAVGAGARGTEFARRGRWAQAAREALLEVAVNPGNRLLWSKAAPLLILAGDYDAYRGLCGRMVEQFRATTDPEQADSVCKLCRLLPDGPDRSQLPVKLLADAADRDATAPPYRSWFHAALALIAYRDGELERAVEHAEKSHAINNRRGPDGALALLALALAQHRLNQAEQAKQSLAEAAVLIPSELASLGSSDYRGPLPVTAGVVGHDWLIAEVLRREAALLIHKDARRPPDAAALRSRGLTLFNQGKLDEALAALREALDQEEQHGWTHYMAGVILVRQAKPDEAARAFRRAVECSPDYAPPHVTLGVMLATQGKNEEAIPLLERAVELEPKFAPAHRILGELLLHQGKVDEAATRLNKALELTPQDRLAIQLHADAIRLQALLPKLDQFVDGTREPADNGQRLDLARLCFYRRRFAASARFYADALDADPKVADDPTQGHRYNAACAAARAGHGEGDAERLDAAERTRLRKQALAWLRAALDAVAKQLAARPPNERPRLLAHLRQWKVDADLASLRDADQVSKLADDEQNSIKALWSDLETVLQHAP